MPTKDTKFKKGNKVKIKKSSRHYGQSLNVGIITSVYDMDDEDSDYIYEVKFPENNNTYREKDLKLVLKTNPAVLILLKNIKCKKKSIQPKKS